LGENEREEGGGKKRVMGSAYDQYNYIYVKITVKPTKNCLKEGEGQVLRKGEFDQSTVDV
jgi:hypothetical protein